MLDSVHVKYLAVNSVDLKWGLAVNSVGYQDILPGCPYPPKEHPERYLFTYGRGRVLSEYQLLYITKGEGLFSSEATGRGRDIRICAGDMFLLFPGVWHTYKPLEESGWKEHWVGFTAEFMDKLVRNGFFSKEKPVLKVGIHSEITDLYTKAIDIASSQESGFQQALYGIVSHILSLTYYYDKNHPYIESDISDRINSAKIIISDKFVTITPKDVAEAVCMSYSNFRKIFKEYTGFSPAQYIQDVKINKAKELLTNTGMTVKEIALTLGYENNDYFFTAFRKKEACTPQDYRLFTQGEKRKEAEQ